MPQAVYNKDCRIELCSSDPPKLNIQKQNVYEICLKSEEGPDKLTFV